MEYLPFSDIVLTVDELEALLATRSGIVLLEKENQADFRRLEHHGFVEINSAFNYGVSSDQLMGKGIGVTKQAARITERGRDYIALILSRVPPGEPSKNPIGFSADAP